MTGVVGVAGIVATSLTAFTQQRNQIKLLDHQRSHQVDDKTQAEAKRAYLTFMDVINEVIASIGDEQWKTPIEAKKFSSEMRRKLASAQNELDIAIPAWLNFYVSSISIRTLLWMSKKVVNEQSATDAYEKLLVAHAELTTVMRAYMSGQDQKGVELIVKNLREFFGRDGGISGTES